MASSVRYTVRILPASHQLEVTLLLAGFSPGPLLVATPTWVPGAYGFMRYARDLSQVRAFAGERALTVVREGWSGFRIEGAEGSVRVQYRADAFDPLWDELSGLVDHEHAVLMGTRYLFAPAHEGPVQVRYLLPEDWNLHHPAGAQVQEDGSWEYPSYAALLDTPVTAGHFERVTRELHGARFHHVFIDRTLGFDSEMPRFVDAVMRVAEACHALFGSFPFEDYTLVFSFNPTAHWGLEHAFGTMIGLGQEVLIDPEAFARGVRVTAHELFHAWNVCRLKPAALAKPDLLRGSFPDGLWVSEGFTRYYEFLLCVRAGVLTPQMFVSNLVNYYRHLAAMPAYQRVSPQDSSRATFLNHNRYPGSVNNTLDYYDQGMCVAFDLDAHLRLSQPPRTLDGEFRAFYEAFASKAGGFHHEDLLRFFDERTPGTGELLRREVEQAGELSVPALLERWGFGVVREQVSYLGLVLKDNVGPELCNVLDTSPAGRSGLAAGDHLHRLNNYPFSMKALRFLLERGEPLTLEVRRGHRYLTFPLCPEKREEITGVRWQGSEEQAARIREWWGCDFSPAVGTAFALDSYENFHGVQTVR